MRACLRSPEKKKQKIIKITPVLQATLFPCKPALKQDGNRETRQAGNYRPSEHGGRGSLRSRHNRGRGGGAGKSERNEGTLHSLQSPTLFHFSRTPPPPHSPFRPSITDFSGTPRREGAGSFSKQWLVIEPTRKGAFFQAGGILKGRDFRRRSVDDRDRGGEL